MHFLLSTTITILFLTLNTVLVKQDAASEFSQPVISAHLDFNMWESNVQVKSKQYLKKYG